MMPTHSLEARIHRSEVSKMYIVHPRMSFIGRLLYRLYCNLVADEDSEKCGRDGECPYCFWGRCCMTEGGYCSIRPEKFR